MCTSHRLKYVNVIARVIVYAVGGLEFTCASLHGATTPTNTPAFRGSSALADTKRAVSFGERPSGSDAIVQLRRWMATELKSTGGELSFDEFTGSTPAGPVPMVNLIVKFPGASGRAIAVTGHYRD